MVMVVGLLYLLEYTMARDEVVDLTMAANRAVTVVKTKVPRGSVVPAGAAAVTPPPTSDVADELCKPANSATPRADGGRVRSGEEVGHHVRRRPWVGRSHAVALAPASVARWLASLFSIESTPAGTPDRGGCSAKVLTRRSRCLARTRVLACHR